MEKEFFNDELKKDLDETFLKEEKDARIERKIKSLPVVGYVKDGATILPASEREDDDDFWTEVYLKEYGEV